MTRDEVFAALTQIGTCEDDVQRRTLLTNVTNELTNVYDSNESLTQSNNTYQTQNEALRSANLELFLQVGNKGKPEHIDEPEVKEMKFEDLFNEKGELK